MVVVQRTLPGLREAEAASRGDGEGGESGPQSCAAARSYFAPRDDVADLDMLRDEAWRAGLPPVSGSGSEDGTPRGSPGGAPPPSPRFISCQYPWRGRGLDLGDAEDAAYVRRVTGNLFSVLATGAKVRLLTD